MWCVKWSVSCIMKAKRGISVAICHLISIGIPIWMIIRFYWPSYFYNRNPHIPYLVSRRATASTGRQVFHINFPSYLHKNSHYIAIRQSNDHLMFIMGTFPCHDLFCIETSPRVSFPPVWHVPDSVLDRFDTLSLMVLLIPVMGA